VDSFALSAMVAALRPGHYIPVALHRFLADRAAAEGVREVPGASHALSVSQPAAVTASVLEAVSA
jgi:hypothetical protein